ncbi:MAG: hypothetical protein V8S08_05230 [Lachnoclostridium sp.]
MEVNEYLLDHKDDDKDDHTPPSGGKTSDDGTAKEDTNKGTLTLMQPAHLQTYVIRRTSRF